MIKTFSLFFILILSISIFGQSYIGRITKKTKLREFPDLESTVLGTLKAGTQIFIASLDNEDGYYDVIDISTNIEGYVLKRYIKVGLQVKENDKNLFVPTAETDSYNPDVEVFNNTDLTLTLKLNSVIYSFKSNEKRVLTLIPGALSYRASAPGVTPCIGIQHVESNHNYTWQFWIESHY